MTLKWKSSETMFADGSITIHHILKFSECHYLIRFLFQISEVGGKWPTIEVQIKDENMHRTLFHIRDGVENVEQGKKLRKDFIEVQLIEYLYAFKVLGQVE